MDITWGIQATTHAVAWNWIIAVYLFLAGVSGGAFLTAALTDLFNRESEGSDKIVRAGAYIAPLTIIIGLVLLIFDLSKPLSFWKLLVYVNWSSVMSIGVFIISAFSAVSVVYAYLVWNKSRAQKVTSLGLAAGETGDESVAQAEVAAMSTMSSALTGGTVQKFVAVIGSLLALGTATYTGFLLSDVSTNALWSLPFIGTEEIPFLPVLFLVSASSAGLAATLIVAREVPDTKVYKKTDLALIALEIFLLLTFYITVNSIYFSGNMGIVFWLGVVVIGLIIPLALTIYALLKHKNWTVPICTAVIVGGFCLRYFIIYAGQLY